MLRSVIDALIHDPSSRISPFRTFTGHTMPVTSLHCGPGALCVCVRACAYLCTRVSLACVRVRAHVCYPCPPPPVFPGGASSRFYSCGLDGVANVWALHTHTPLASAVFPSPLTAIATDVTGGRMFCGAADGSVFATDLHAVAAKQVCVCATYVCGGHV